MKQRRYHIIVASIVFAVLMWVSINMGYEYTLTRQIPVVLENMKEGTAFRYAIPKFVTVRFKGLGWQLAALYLSPDVKYFIDVSSLTKKEFAITESELLEHVKLPVAVLPLDVKPDTLMLALDTYKEKRVTIVPSVALLYREGFGQVGSLRVQPESVVISGAKSMIDSITQWQTAYRRYDNLRTSIDENIAVEETNSYAVEIYPSIVRLRVEVQPFAEKTIAGVPITATSLPNNREVIFIPPKVDVTIRGGIDQLAKISTADVQATVDYNILLQDSVGVVDPVLNIPEGVRVLHKSPDRFQFLIRKRL